MYCTRTQRLNEWPHALRIRWQHRSGKLAGFRNGWAAYRQRTNCSQIKPPTWSADPQG
jgi:hypothetical protein